MKRKFLTLTFFCTLLLLSNQVNAQVTIGSSNPPVGGALLDLKQQTPDANNVTASKGLGLPRVKLTDYDQLFPMFDAISGTDYVKGGDSFDKDTQDAAHTGLVVYHEDKCTMTGKGVYVWVGTEWQPLHKKNTFVPTLSQTYFDIPSGRDARGTTIPSETLTVTWEGGATPTWALQNTSGLTQLPLTSPAATGTVGASPYVMTITATAMTAAETPASNPWKSKERKIAFTNLVTECGQQDYVTINQTNYALKVNNQFSNSQITYTTASSGTFAVQGNAAWKATLASDPNNVIASTTPALPTTGGEDKKDGTTVTLSPNFSYTTNAASKYHTADITFQDTATVKRFDDITVTILNCSNTNEPTLEQWAERLGFTTAEITAVKNGTAPNDGGVSSDINNSYQLHRDQDGNLFISSEFGNDAASSDGKNRWMITNLAARSFAADAGRTGDEGAVVIALPGSPSAASDYANPQWCYPQTPTTATTFTNNPRIGLLYNWAAATNSKGRKNSSGVTNTTGQGVWNDGEGGSGQTPQTNKIQGICPNGWHLPSDREFTDLEQIISDNTATYSGIPDAGTGITVGATNWRGTTHGTGMKDPCPAPNQTTYQSNGASNVMSPHLAGGFNIILAGYANSGSAGGYGTHAYLWSAGGNSTNTAWYRTFINSYAQVARFYPNRRHLFSVRCKKD
ncbi:FISUMP domain-containing protein [Dysgonomonas sp. 25]|uniref:FISUMP domain-containing protein n=1 Tax=Dysgonomonas sp. 25 TaxID=2302933 RepID=UPI0013D56052|nr:FISUMP domain-containing protein [Dysgonomonas sp. 25]NDV70288.1 hypothetical protein [Dysgonomonas sp. 25]